MKYFMLVIGVSLMGLAINLDPLGDYWDHSVFFGGLFTILGASWIIVGDDEMNVASKGVFTNVDIK